jgi:hypothetical protein
MRSPVGMVRRLHACWRLRITGCSGKKDSPGPEYMPDMYRGPAVEAYVDYGQDPYYFDNDSLVEAQRGTQSATLPPAGTIPFAAKESARFNFPYPYPNTPEGYERPAWRCTAPSP